MNLITGCAKIIPFHCFSYCLTATGAERCQNMNQWQLYRHYVPVLCLRLAGSGCQGALHRLELTVRVFLFAVCNLHCELVSSGS